ncbi:MAG: hypothetical protein V6Z82_01425 [Flavobacteriales bacterium]
MTSSVKSKMKDLVESRVDLLKILKKLIDAETLNKEKITSKNMTTGQALEIKSLSESDINRPAYYRSIGIILFPSPLNLLGWLSVGDRFK